MKTMHKKIAVFYIGRKYVLLIDKMYRERSEVERNRRTFKAKKDIHGNVVYYLLQNKNRHYQVYVYANGKCVYTGREYRWHRCSRFAISENVFVVKGIDIPIIKMKVLFADNSLNLQMNENNK